MLLLVVLVVAVVEMKVQQFHTQVVQATPQVHLHRKVITVAAVAQQTTLVAAVVGLLIQAQMEQLLVGMAGMELHLLFLV
jgi:hypothetical protein